MNVFGWLFGRRQAPLAAPSEAHSVMLGDETRPLVRGRDGWIDPPEVHHFSAPTPRPDQFARREMLYVVIRESMMRAGILSAAYKFKVLSLDRKGRRFLVMMDVARDAGGGHRPPERDRGADRPDRQGPARHPGAVGVLAHS